MIILLLLLALSLLAIATLAGPISLLLRKTTFAKYAVELSLLLFPSFIVLSGSLLGHVYARNADPLWILLAILLGILTTLVTAFRERNVLLAAARENTPRIFAIVSLALVAGLVVVPRQVTENKLGYLEFMNGEFLNYSQLAVLSMGNQHSDLPTAFLAQHQAARDGTDFINSALARFTGAAPVDIVQLASAFLRISYCTLCLLIIWEVRSRTVSGILISAILLLSFIFCNIDIYAFQVSFMASNAAMGVFVLLLVLLALSDRLTPAPFLCIYCLGNLHLLVTYPEIMPFLKICEGVYYLERALARGKQHLRWSLPLANFIVFLSNPSLVLRKIQFVHNLLTAEAGWNFLGSPIDDAPIYLKRLVGLSYNFVPDSLVIAPLSALGVFLAGAILAVYGLGCLSRRLNTRAVWLIPLGLVWFHLAPLMTPPETGPRNFYGAGKFILLWTWVVPLSLAAAIPGIRTRVGQVALAASLVFLLVGNLVALSGATAFELSLPTFYSQQLGKTIVRTIKAQHGRVVIASEQTTPALYWFQLLDSAGVNPVILSPAQANLIARGANAPFLPPTPSPSSGEAVLLVQPTKLLWFSNLNIIEVEESTALFNKMTKSNVTVIAGKLLLSAPQVELREAIVQDTHNSN